MQYAVAKLADFGLAVGTNTTSVENMSARAGTVIYSVLESRGLVINKFFKPVVTC